MPTSKARAIWEGGLQAGEGRFSSDSGAIEGRYTAGTRFTDAGGSNPEELLAAADAACFSMALSAALEREGYSPRRIETDAACTIEKVDDGWKVTRIKLKTRGNVPGVSDADFQRFAAQAKDGCPVSTALKGNVQIDVEAILDAGA